MKRNKFNPLNFIDWIIPLPMDQYLDNKVPISSIEQLYQYPSYRTKTRRFTYLVFLLLILNITSVIFYFNLKKEETPKVYEVSQTDVLKNNTKNFLKKPLIVFEQPLHTEEVIQRWADITLNNLYNFDYLNFEQRLDEIQPYFTESGYNKFLKGLQNAKMDDYFIKEKHTVNTIVFGKIRFPAAYGNKKIISNDNNLYYQIYVPMRMTVQKGNHIDEYDTEFNILLAVLVDNKGKTGLFIHEFDMTPPQKVMIF